MNNSFDSIDKLVEFGMSIAVAQQMINTMNHCINNMVVPGVQNAAVQLQQYFVVVNGAQSGPFLEKDLIDLVKQHKIENNTLVWRTGLQAWTYAGNLPEINKLFALY